MTRNILDTMQVRISLVCLFAMVGMMYCVHASAEIYKWTDKDGRVHYNDKPAAQDSSERIHINTAPADSGGSSTAEDAVVEPIGESRRTSEKQPLDVVMYATKTCGYCMKARAFFTQRGVSWNEIDINSSERANSEFKSRGGRGVPLVFINGQRIRGWDEAEWQSVLSRYGY